MRQTKSQENHLRRVIRDAVAIDPLISSRSLQAVVEKKAGRFLSLNYVQKLMRKVDGELVMRADPQRVEKKIMYLRERNRVICEELFRMAFPPESSIEKPSVMDRRKALEAIARIEATQTKLEMDFGVFERHLGTLDHDHRLKAVDEQTLTDIITTFKAWAMPPEMRRIEAVRTIEGKVTIITNEPPKQEPKRTGKSREQIPVVTGTGLVKTE